MKPDRREKIAKKKERLERLWFEKRCKKYGKFPMDYYIVPNSEKPWWNFGISGGGSQ